MTKKLSVELTNRCNLTYYNRCTDGHSGRSDLSLIMLQQIIVEAKPLGFEEICFTGVDPTVYRHFGLAVRLASEAGYYFTFATKGENFAQTCAQFLPYRTHLGMITFSLAGASVATHDPLRGTESYRRVLQAMRICAMHKLPFAIEMVVTAHNRHELAQMAHLAHRLGSHALRFDYPQPSPLTMEMDADLLLQERKGVEAEIHELRRQFSFPIAMAPTEHTTDRFPYAALYLHEVKIDCYGNLTAGCQPSGSVAAKDNPIRTSNRIGNLARMSFTKAYEQLVEEDQQYAKYTNLQEFRGDPRHTRPY